YGAAPKVEMRKGTVVTNLIPDFSFRRWLGFKGQILDVPFLDICRSQVDVSIQGYTARLVREMRGFHWMTCYGDYLKETGYALAKLGIELVNISA
ncbi:MAG: sugar isomerase, partial [Bryobacteraceae bacterium]